MKYTKKFMILVLLIAGFILGISYMLTRSNEQQESITGTLTLSSDDKIEPINIGDNVDLNYNYITNPTGSKKYIRRWTYRIWRQGK